MNDPSGLLFARRSGCFFRIGQIAGLFSIFGVGFIDETHITCTVSHLHVSALADLQEGLSTESVLLCS